jgi:sialate O-acetylesterase
MRDVQVRLPSLVRNSGAVNTIDLVFPYEHAQIHPAAKEPVGQRFAWLALHHTYGFSHIVSDGPVYRSMEIHGSEIRCYISNGDTTISPFTDIVGLEIAGEDRVFVPAVGKVGGRTLVVVSSPNVTKPVAVRYCFKDFQVGNLVNQRSIPVFPFRTDNWTIPELPEDFWESVISKLPVG